MYGIESQRESSPRKHSLAVWPKAAIFLDPVEQQADCLGVAVHRSDEKL
jgi:hypothetical protein